MSSESRFIAFAGFVLATSLAACSYDERPSGVAVPTTTLDSSSVVARDSAPPADDSTVTDASIEDAVVVEDSTPDLGPPPDAAIFARCSSSQVAYAAKGLVAAGRTPKAFADAYNAEVAALSYPGPMLLVFKGVDSADSSSWKLHVGALDVTGSGVKFLSTPAEVSYRMSAGIALEVPDQTASFKLRFDSATTTTMLPVDGLRVTATAGDCTELSVDELVLIIPESAKSMKFAGKAVGELMGPPIAPDGGPRFFVLELLGSEKKVTLAEGTP